MKSRWQILNKKPVQNSTPDEVILLLLQNRGLTDSSDFESFLNPPHLAKVDFSSLIPTEKFQQTKDLIDGAIQENRPIIIHGDYDVDGICATAILWETIYLDMDYENVRPFIPHRIEHGYGVTKNSIKEVASSLENNNAVPLIITVDSGITAKEAIEYAKNLNMEVIITDHHTLPQALPAAKAILHTTELSGTGIAWLLARKLSESYLSEPEKNLDLVALATIADLQPLLGINRPLTKFGLEELNQTQRLGIKALIKVAGMTKRKIGSYEVGWILAPRLNASGRLEHAIDSLRLLCTRNQAQAERLAQKLNQINSERQIMTQKSVKQAEELAKNQLELKNSSLLVIYHEEWHEGITGLVAGKIVEEFYRPTIAIAKGAEFSKGSARSINGFNIIEALRELEEFFVDVGGHPMAAGFTIATEKIEVFSQKFTQKAEQVIDPEKLSPLMTIDLILPPEMISMNLAEKLKNLEPFGVGNPRPIFLTPNLKIVNLYLVGQENQHLKLSLTNSEGRYFSAIGFHLGHMNTQLNLGDNIDLVYTLEKDFWNGKEKLELKIKDLRPCLRDSTSEIPIDENDLH